MMNDNVRPETMERITTKELAQAFIDEQVAKIQKQVKLYQITTRYPQRLYMTQKKRTLKTTSFYPSTNETLYTPNCFDIFFSIWLLQDTLCM